MWVSVRMSLKDLCFDTLDSRLRGNDGGALWWLFSTRRNH